MEPEVVVKCRKSDLELVESVLDDAVRDYKQILKDEVPIFKDREVPCRISVTKERFLPEYSEGEGKDSCLGGIKLLAKKGKIVCSNTLDDRLQLIYQEAIPDIRIELFPSLVRK